MSDLKTKTIEVDEILPAPSSGKATHREHRHGHREKDHQKKSSPKPSSPNTDTDPFPDIASALGWKARLTLQITQWFLFLRAKSWGKWVIGPVVILGILLAIPLAFLAITALFLLSLFRALFPPKTH